MPLCFYSCGNHHYFTHHTFGISVSLQWFFIFNRKTSSILFGTILRFWTLCSWLFIFSFTNTKLRSRYPITCLLILLMQCSLSESLSTHPQLLIQERTKYHIIQIHPYNQKHRHRTHTKIHNHQKLYKQWNCSRHYKATTTLQTYRPDICWNGNVMHIFNDKMPTSLISKKTDTITENNLFIMPHILPEMTTLSD